MTLEPTKTVLPIPPKKLFKAKVNFWTFVSFTPLTTRIDLPSFLALVKASTTLATLSILEEAPVVRALYNSAANRASSEADTKNL